MAFSTTTQKVVTFSLRVMQGICFLLLLLVVSFSKISRFSKHGTFLNNYYHHFIINSTVSAVINDICDVKVISSSLQLLYKVRDKNNES